MSEKTLTYKIEDEFQSGSVEQRSGKPHNVPAPIYPGDEGFKEQVSDYLLMCQEAKLDDSVRKNQWTDRLEESLRRHWPFESRMVEPRIAMNCVGLNSWRETSIWVKDDKCPEMFTRMVDYCRKSGIPVRENMDFIDGQGIGWYQAYLNMLKTHLEKAFDAKWHYKLLRPEEFFRQMFGTDCVIIYNQPGHCAYPQGHGTKFYCAYMMIKRIFDLDAVDPIHDNILLTAAYAGSQGRCGGGVHWPQDTVGSAHVCNLL